VPAGIHAMRLDGPTDTVLVVWVDKPGVRGKVEFARRGLVSATDIVGKALKVKNGRVALNDAAGPIYLRWQR
jgi:hypothetical protein